MQFGPRDCRVPRQKAIFAMSDCLHSQPQSITIIWPVLISRPAEGRTLSCLGGWLHTEVVCPSEDGHPYHY